MKKINNAVGSIGRSRPEPGMIKNLHFTDKNEQRMVTHPVFPGRVITLGSSLLIAVNRLYGGVCIQGDGIKSGLIQPTGIVVQQHGLQKVRAPLWPSFLSVEDMAFSLMAFFKLSMTLTRPSPEKVAMWQRRLIPLNEAKTTASSIWLTPNFVALCHCIGEVRSKKMYDALLVHVF